MQKSALLSLPGEWQLWINTNLARACEPDEMARLMVRDGRFAHHLAVSAIHEAASAPDIKAHRAAAPIAAMPHIDSRQNVIHTTDRTIDVLLALQSPRLVLLGNVLSEEECDALVAYCGPRLAPSPVVDDDGPGNRLHAHRTSRGAMLQRAETALIGRIDARLGELANWPADHGEGLQVLRYGVQDEYRAHFDWFDPVLPGPRKHLQHGGQRLATFVLYLAEVEQGGGTGFPSIGLEVMPHKGSAIFFANTDAAGTPDQLSLHAGLPVVKGVKYVANKWLRASAYR